MTQPKKGEEDAASQVQSPAQAADSPPDSAPRAEAPRAAAAPQVQVDDSNALAAYANFCRVTGSPEELIIDFGLNDQPMGVPNKPVPLTHRIVTNYYTAKRLLQVLQISIQRHEAAFGVLETDVMKRVRPGAAPQRG